MSLRERRGRAARNGPWRLAQIPEVERFTADVMPETPKGIFDAKVVVVDKVINAASGTFGVRLELPNAKKELPAGARCKVRFFTGAKTAPPVPASTARPSR